MDGSGYLLVEVSGYLPPDANASFTGTQLADAKIGKMFASPYKIGMKSPLSPCLMKKCTTGEYIILPMRRLIISKEYRAP
jgi:hypothetical protein